MRATQQERRARVREIVVAAKAVPCVDCGRSYPVPVMDFDHGDGDGKTARIADWARLVGCGRKALAKLREEIAKCDVVCANCHRLRHFEPEAA